MDFELPRGGVLRRAEQVRIEPRPSLVIHHDGQQQYLPVVQGDAQLAAVGPQYDLLHRPLAQMRDGVGDATKVVDRCQRHATLRDGGAGYDRCRLRTS